MTAPDAYAWSGRDAGVAHVSPEQVITVSSNADWGLKISADRADGRMAEFAGSSYVADPKVLTNPLQWGLTRVGLSARTPAWTDLSATAATVLSGQPPTSCSLTGCLSVDVGVKYRLVTSFADRSAAPNSYRIRLTYTAQHGF